MSELNLLVPQRNLKACMPERFFFFFKAKSLKLATMITSLELVCDINTRSPQLTFKVMDEFWKTMTVMRFLAEL